MTKAFRSAILATVTGVMLGGCSGDSKGPLIADRANATVCHNAKGDSLYTEGNDWLLNDGDSEISLVDVELIDAKRMKLIKAVVLPELKDPTSASGVGLAKGYPPSYYTGKGSKYASNRAYWEKRQEIGEATIDGHKQKNLVLGVKSSRKSSMEGVRISYEVNGHQYTAETTTRVRFRPDCDAN